MTEIDLNDLKKLQSPLMKFRVILIFIHEQIQRIISESQKLVASSFLNKNFHLNCDFSFSEYRRVQIYFALIVNVGDGSQLNGGYFDTDFRIHDAARQTARMKWGCQVRVPLNISTICTTLTNFSDFVSLRYQISVASRIK